jgi:hypothetical protein
MHHQYVISHNYVLSRAELPPRWGAPVLFRRFFEFLPASWSWRVGLLTMWRLLVSSKMEIFLKFPFRVYPC